MSWRRRETSECMLILCEQKLNTEYVLQGNKGLMEYFHQFTKECVAEWKKRGGSSWHFLLSRIRIEGGTCIEGEEKPQSVFPSFVNKS